MRYRYRTDECTCKPRTSLRDLLLGSACRNGRCIEWRCPRCRGLLGSVGPVGCGCDGYPIRMMFHPGMRYWGRPAAVKPSIARRGRRRHARR
jgi:hypothetical protein